MIHSHGRLLWRLGITGSHATQAPHQPVWPHCTQKLPVRAAQPAGFLPQAWAWMPDGANNTVLDVSGNDLTGPIPDAWSRRSPNWQRLVLMRNSRMCGALPAWANATWSGAAQGQITNGERRSMARGDAVRTRPRRQDCMPATASNAQATDTLLHACCAPTPTPRYHDAGPVHAACGAVHPVHPSCRPAPRLQWICGQPYCQWDGQRHRRRHGLGVDCDSRRPAAAGAQQHRAAASVAGRYPERHDQRHRHQLFPPGRHARPAHQCHHMEHVERDAGGQLHPKGEAGGKCCDLGRSPHAARRCSSMPLSLTLCTPRTTRHCATQPRLAHTRSGLRPPRAAST